MSEGTTHRGTICIAGRTVGPGFPCYVIAEAGSNHDGDLDRALDLIDAAAEAGADAVKFQNFAPDTLYSSKTPEFDYLGDGLSLREIIADAAMPRDWVPTLAARAGERGIHFFSSPFDWAAVDVLASVGVPAVKIASFEIVDLGLIEHSAGLGVPVILSTGMATYGEIEEAMAAARRGGATEIALLKCSSLYPAPPQELNLRGIESLARAFRVPVGFSDHSLGTVAAPVATALGACIIEKHFTVDKTLPGPDHAFALEPPDLKGMISGIRLAEQALGTGDIVGPSAAEAVEMYAKARRSIVAARDIRAGEVLDRSMLTVKRPGTGLAPRWLPLLVGHRAGRDIAWDEPISMEMLDRPGA